MMNEIKVTTTRRNTNRWPGVLCITFISAGVWAAPKGDLAEFVPHDVIYFSNNQRIGDPGEEPQLQNYKVSLETWLSAMDDILEWRIVHEELKRTGWLSGDEQDSDKEVETAGFWKDLTENEHGIALFLPTLSQGGGVPIVLYLVRAKDPKAIENRFLELADRLKEQGIPTGSEAYYYEDVTVTSVYMSNFRMPGLTLSTACLEDTFLLSTGTGVLERVIDSATLGNGNLTGSSAYNRVLSQLPKDRDALSFANVERIAEVLDDAVQQILVAASVEDPGQIQAYKDIVENLRPYLEGIHGCGSSTRWTKQGREKVKYCAFADEVVEHPYGKMLAGEPYENDVLRFAPRRSMSVVSWNTPTLENIWGTIREIAGRLGPIGAEVQKAIEETQAEFRIVPERDLFPWMEGELAHIQAPATADSLIPIKHQALLIKIKDRDGAQAFLGKLFGILDRASGQSLLQTTSVYQDTELISIQIPLPMIPYQPTVCIADDYLIVSTARSYTEELLDVRAGEAYGLERTKKYKSLASLYKRPARAFFYNDVSKGLNEFKDNLQRLQSFGSLAQGIGGIAAENMPEGVAPQDAPFPPEAMEAMNLATVGVDRLVKLMQIMTVVQVEGARTDVVDNGLLTTAVTGYRDLARQQHVDPQSRRPVSFFAKQHLLEVAREVHQNAPKPFGADIALYLADLVQRYIPEQSDEAYRFMAEVYKKQGNQEKATAMLEKIGQE